MDFLAIPILISLPIFFLTLLLWSVRYDTLRDPQVSADRVGAASRKQSPVAA